MRRVWLIEAMVAAIRSTEGGDDELRRICDEPLHLTNGSVKKLRDEWEENDYVDDTGAPCNSIEETHAAIRKAYDAAASGAAMEVEDNSDDDTGPGSGSRPGCSLRASMV